ncbi:MAG TPA: PHP domain-containing protein [Candidatus Hydrogenedentes bacterium]|nr:PHP domain-containing protein [Candidatus Hydrogenedentota bacterium]HIJ74106.1 PHP domain-containing protein [Candidatus Hydrogenedentota bacterium]
MSICIDLHLHTNRYSPCSSIEPEQMVRQAANIGLDAAVITEHHHQWSEEELAALVEEAGEPNFLLMTGFEYCSAQGDFLIYGLTEGAAFGFEPGLAPESVVEQVHWLGGACIAAHPTRAGMSFDERIASMRLDGIEVQSINLKEHEQRLAMGLASNLNIPASAGSDAHQLQHVGAYATVFEEPIQSMADFVAALRGGRFRPVDGAAARLRGRKAVGDSR